MQGDRLGDVVEVAEEVDVTVGTAVDTEVIMVIMYHLQSADAWSH